MTIRCCKGRAGDAHPSIRTRAATQILRGQGQPALGMVGRPKPVELPQAPGHGHILEGLTLAPPEVPELSQIIVRPGLLTREFVGQEASDSEQSSLEGERAEFRFGWEDARAQFPKPLHRPDVVLVAQSPQPAFPKGLLPAGMAGAGLKLSRFALQPHQRGLVQQLRQFVLRQSAQGSGALA